MRFWCVFLIAALCSPAVAERPWTRIVPSSTVELRDPCSMSVAANGVIYVADTGHHRVVAFDGTGNVIAETGGLGSAHGQFQWPRAVIGDRGNSIWVLDYGNRRIEKFTRFLEYQGTLEIRTAGQDRTDQPDALALSPQGDLFVYDRDDGKLLRYDPLFTLQAESGSGSGSQFISNVASMAFVPRRGLYWWERGGNRMRRADPLLNPAAALPWDLSEGDWVLSDADTCLIFASQRGVFRSCKDDVSPDTLVTSSQLPDSGNLRIAAIGVAGQFVYVLDRGTGAVYRTDLLSE